MARNTHKTRYTSEKRDWQEFRQIICAAALYIVLGRIFLGHQGPPRRNMQGPLSVFQREWPGYPAIWAGTSRDQKKLYATKPWADFFVP